MTDVYFNEKYGKLYEKVENGTAEIFRLKTENGNIVNQFIKRKIPMIVDGKTYYDIVTPYGYGGPIIIDCVNKDELLLEYENEFEQYCITNNIISEFVRFHPIKKNYIDFEKIYHAEFNRYTLATNVGDFEDPIMSEFSKSCRKTIRQVLKEGINFRMVENPTWDDMKRFMQIYYLNMERKDADDYYFFDEKYFQDIYKNFSGQFVIAESIYEDKVIAAGLYFITDGNVHAHLSGTDTEYLRLSPAYILKYGTVLWAKENNYKFIHYGGGVSSDLEDPLYLFKCKFAKNTKLEFWIGRKVWNSDIYYKLCELANVAPDEKYFPAYRKNNTK